MSELLRLRARVRVQDKLLSQLRAKNRRLADRLQKQMRLREKWQQAAIACGGFGQLRVAKVERGEK
jgi:hypothetical protein